MASGRMPSPLEGRGLGEGGAGSDRATDPTRAPLSPALSPKGEEENSVTLAAVIGAHGVVGEVRLKLFTADLTPYRSFNGGTLTLTSVRNGIARFAEVADRNAAERLRGTALTVARSELPPLDPGEYYHVDLIGLPCEIEGEAIGMAVAIDDFGAGDVLEIERPDGQRFMVPIARAVTIEPDRLLIDPAFVEA